MTSNNPISLYLLHTPHKIASYSHHDSVYIVSVHDTTASPDEISGFIKGLDDVCDRRTDLTGKDIWLYGAGVVVYLSYDSDRHTEED